MNFKLENLQSVTPADQRAIRELTLKRLEEFGFRSIPEFDSDLDDLHGSYLALGGAIFVVRKEGRIVGTIMVKVASENIGEIKRFQLLPEFRGKGAGRALLGAAMDYMQKHDFKKAVLDTTEKSVAAISLFDEVGFVESRREGNQIFFENSFVD